MRCQVCGCHYWPGGCPSICNTSLDLLLVTPEFPGLHVVRTPPTSRQLHLPYPIQSFSSLVGLIAWVLVSTTKKELDEKRRDALFDDYDISVGLIAPR